MEIDSSTTLQVNDVFESISGEAGGFPQGTWVTFIRLQGCNLNCAWCDTPLAKKESASKNKTIFQLRNQVYMLKNKHILITGGEPLSQVNVIELINGLLEDGYEVQVETNGSVPIPIIPAVHWVIDFKCPSSGVVFDMSMESFMYQLEVLSRIQSYGGAGSCCIKFVIADDADLDYTLQAINYFILNGVTVPFLISPIDAQGNAIPSIVEKIKQRDESLVEHITFSVQLHKIFNLP